MPGPEHELALIGRIVELLQTMPSSRVAALLTAQGVPAPDCGRWRTDGGVKHPTSGVWHQSTIVNISRNPLLRAVVEYGRGSLGDQTQAYLAVGSGNPGNSIYVYDLADELTKVTDPNAYNTAYHYDTVGHMTEEVDGAGYSDASSIFY